MNLILRRAVNRLKKMTPAERAKLLVASGSIPPEFEAEAAARLAAADAAKAAETAAKAAQATQPAPGA
jgi:fructose-1-phosphate kinase PfkB-like protein